MVKGGVFGPKNGLTRLPTASRLAERVERFLERLVDHHHRGAGDVGALEAAPLHDRDPHRLQIVHRHRLVVVDVGRRLIGRRRVALEAGVVGVHLAIGREPGHRRDAGHAGQLAQAGHQAIEEGDARRPPSDRRAGQHHAEGRHVLAVEAGIDRHQLLKAAEEKAGADDEDDGERDFGHDQAAAHARARAARGGALPAFLERDRDHLLAQVQQRRHAEDQAGDDRHAEREQQHLPVERDVEGARNAVGVRGEQRAETAEADRHAQGAADQREQHAFGEKLPAAAGSGRRPAPIGSRTPSGATRRARGSGWRGWRRR